MSDNMHKIGKIPCINKLFCINYIIIYGHYYWSQDPRLGVHTPNICDVHGERVSFLLDTIHREQKNCWKNHFKELGKWSGG